MRSRWIFLIALAGCTPGSVTGNGGGRADHGENPLGLVVTYDEQLGRVRVSLPQPLAEGEQLYVRPRRGHFHTIDCADVLRSVDALEPDGSSYLGPSVPFDLLRAFYGPEWANPPTRQMIDDAGKGTDSILDTCLVRDGEVAFFVETDLFVAWDRGSERSANLLHRRAGPRPPDGAEAIHSVQKYAELCVQELGEIPFFEKMADGKYSTYSCLDSTPIPMTVTDADGNVSAPQTGQEPKCDKPEYIYSLCEAGPRVASRANADGTHWVLLCRKSIGGYASSEYNDIAMIGHNPFTGKTCFFQNALYSKTDGAHVPHPADVEKSSNLWSGVHGGMGSGIECVRCHDADPLIHSPWIDGALGADGNPVIPKMGVHPDFAIGANDAPYSIVNLAVQGWTMQKHLVSAEASACTRCHRIGGGRWLSWASRLDGTDTYFRGVTTDAYLSFDKIHWMPPTLAMEGIGEADWAASKYGKALDFIKACGNDSSHCQFAEIPSQ